MMQSAPQTPRMRVRHRLMIAVIAAHLALTAVGGAFAWHSLDATLRAQARASAMAVAKVLADGGYSRNPQIIARMQTLTGHSFRLERNGSNVGADLIAVPSGEDVVVVDYRTAQYRSAQRDLVWILAMVGALGTAIFALVAWVISRRFARPVEALAVEAQRLGDGDWQAPVVVTRGGDAEVAQLAQALDDMRQRLMRLDAQRRTDERLAALGTFAATIAHEVRNPLSAVRLAAQLIAKEHPEEGAVTLILDEIERLDLIVDELLGAAKGMTIAPQSIALRTVVDDVVRLLRRQAEHAGIALTVGGAAQVMADPRRLRQVLINLVLNAIQATQSGDGSRVAIAITSDGFMVSDDGRGISSAAVPHIFTAFASGRQDGTGLGLHLAATVIAAHGATLTYEAVKPRGACFRVGHLPPVSVSS